jgi:hypothetical protein
MKLNKSRSRLHSLLNLIAPSFHNFWTCLCRGITFRGIKADRDMKYSKKKTAVHT